MAAAVQKDGSIALRGMERSLGPLNGAYDESQYQHLYSHPYHLLTMSDKLDAAIAAMVLQHSTACMQYQMADDIFASVAQGLSSGKSELKLHLKIPLPTNSTQSRIVSC